MHIKKNEWQIKDFFDEAVMKFPASNCAAFGKRATEPDCDVTCYMIHVRQC